MTLPAATAQRRAGAAEWALGVASALSVVLAAGAAEIALRVARPSFLRHSRVEHPHVYSEIYGWALRPNTHYFGRDGETITVNARGYRGPLHSDAPAPGVTRVVMLGDSITFGTGVGDADTFSDRLDARPDLDVVNLAVDGYGTDQELIRLEREGLACHPDVVVLNFCVRNDYFDNALPVALYDGRSRKPYFTLSGATLTLHDAQLRLSRRQRAAGALMEESHLINTFLYLGGAAPEAAGGEREEEGYWDDRRRMVLADFERASELTRRIILAMAERSAAAGAAFVVLIHPDRRAWSGDDAMVTPLTSGGLGRTRIVLMLGEYRARRLSFEEVSLDRLGHLSPKGHAAASEIIRDVIDSLPGRR